MVLLYPSGIIATAFNEIFKDFFEYSSYQNQTSGDKAQSLQEQKNDTNNKNSK